ncbi:MAG: hypothetical protein LBD24_01545 [Spirochaetaceae bacterium]|nr:hypothetical protein [Spirochaetaceae bacterium]
MKPSETARLDIFLRALYILHSPARSVSVLIPHRNRRRPLRGVKRDAYEARRRAVGGPDAE